MSKVIKTVGILFFVLIVLVAAIFVLTQTDYFRNTMKSVVEKLISSSAGQNFAIGKIEGDLINGIMVKDVSFKIEGEPFVHVDEISAKYSLLSILDVYAIFSKVVPIKDVSLRGVSVNFIRDENGIWNVNKLGGEKGKNESHNWNFFIKNLLITNAKITVEDKGKKETSRIEIQDMDSSIKMFGITKEIALDLKKADIYTSPQQLNIKGLSAKVLYTENKVRVKDLSADINGTNVKFDGEVNNFSEPEFKIRAAAYGLDIKKSVLNIQAQGSGRYKSPQYIEAELNVRLLDSQIMGRKVWGSIERIKMLGTDVEVQNGVLKTEFGEMSFSGNANMEQLFSRKGINQFQSKLSLRNVNPSRILEIIKNQIDFGIADGDFNVEGRWKQIKDLEVKVNINQFRQRGKPGEINLKGLVEATRSNAKFDLVSNLNKVNLSPILNDRKYASNLNSNLRFKGTVPLGGKLERLTATLDGEILPSSVSDVNLTEGKVSASYASKTLDIKSLSLTSDLFRLKTQGTLTEEKRVDLGYDTDVNDLKLISKFSPGIDLKGSLHATGKVQGEIKNPQVTFSARISDFEYKGVQVKLANLDGNTSVNFENLQFGVKGTLSGVQFEKRDIKSVDFRAISEGRGLRGNFSILEDPQRSYEIELRLADIESREKSIRIDKVKINLENRTLQNRDVIDLTVSPDRAVVKSLNLYYGNNFIRGDVTADFNGPIIADLDLKRINLVDISQSLGLKTPVRGVASGSINFQGTPEQPNIKANLGAQGLGFMDFMSDNSSLNLSYSNKSLNIDFTAVEDAQEVLSVKGRASVDLNLKNVQENIKDATFNLALKSSGIDVSPLVKLNEEIREIHGKAILDLRASGSVKSPKINGQVRLQNISLKTQSLRNEIRATTGLIEMQGERGVLRTLEIQTDDGGRGTLQGNFDLSNLSYNLNGKMTDFGINLKQVTAKMDGDVGIKGSDGKINITGDVRVKRARITIPEEPAKQVEDIKFVDSRKEEPQQFVINEVKQTDYFRDNVGMSLNVFIPGNVWAKGKGANVEVKGRIGVIKKYGEPIILTGNIETIRGTYEFFGKLFRIEQGRVSFQGTPEINPFLGVRALYKVSNAKIFVDVNGTVEKPTVKLSSEPPMDQTDIFSYLVFGTSSDKIGSGERVNLQSKAAEVAALMAAGKLKDIVGAKFQLDVVSITGGEKGLQDTQIEVGKYLTDKLYIAYERSSADTVSTPYTSTATQNLTNKVRVEYRLFDFLTLESTVGAYDQGGDIFFTFDY